jgi:hypothetical protein
MMYILCRHWVVRHSLSDTPGFGGSTTFGGRVGSPQSMYVNESIIEEKAPQGI